MKSLLIPLLFLLLISWKPNNGNNQSNYKVLSAEELFNKIKIDNKGKVIYLDCWATWCGPCVKAMPDSKALMQKMAGKDVSFVYVCIESFEKSWKRKLSSLGLEKGQHYRLTMEQSKSFRKLLNIEYVPTYILIDKTGTIIEQGFDLHPHEAETEEKILKLLES